MEKIIEIPEGYEARIEGNKVVLEPKESEDERITRAINNMLPFIPDEAYANNGVTKEGVLNWLEKQKEQPMEMLEPDNNVEKAIEGVIRVYGKTQGKIILGYDMDTLIVNLRRAFNKKEQKPAEWSKEDEKCCKIALLALNDHPLNQDELKTFNWLRALKSRFGWKPSEEQMEALEHSLGDYHIKIFEERHKLLSSLYHDLKKLK